MTQQQRPREPSNTPAERPQTKKSQDQRKTPNRTKQPGNQNKKKKRKQNTKRRRRQPRGRGPKLFQRCFLLELFGGCFLLSCFDVVSPSCCSDDDGFIALLKAF